ncbi:MAG: hypothetical protein LBM96_06940 [Methanobrevibacter sp.]|nr:hypothetical protein [Candidatus Methanoflexus mossambicus]
MSEIKENILFKLENGEVLELHQNLVGIKTREGGLWIINIRSHVIIMGKIQEFFDGLRDNMEVNVDIGETGDVKTYFRGISPVLQKTNDQGAPYAFVSITLQESNKFVPVEDEDDGHCCSIKL